MMKPVWERPGEFKLTEELLAASRLAPGSRILDGGCGSGATAAWLRQQGYEAWGIDQRLSEDAAALWLQRGDVRRLPWLEECFDGYLSECTLSICGETRQALEEAWRVLRPQGRLLIADVYERSEAPSPLLSQALWQRLLAETGFVLDWWADRSAYWKPFVVEALWAGKSLDEVTCGLAASAQIGQIGYFVLTATKKGRQYDE